MSLDRNGQSCRHNVTQLDPDTNEYFCLDCGDVVDEVDDEYSDTD